MLNPEALPERAGAKRKRALLWSVGVVVSSLIFVAIASRLVASSSPDGYGEGLRRDFVAACGRAAGADTAKACGCTYDQLAVSVPYERFRQLDAALRTGGTLPSDIGAMVTACS